MSLVPQFSQKVTDDKEALIQAIRDSLAQCDFIVLTGGVSVGDFDFVQEAAANCGVEKVFWKVRQKPGKPMYFGKTEGGKFVFGLPGNPASALVCFYEFVRPALLRAMGSGAPFLPALSLPLGKAIKIKNSRPQFLRAFVKTHGQEAHVEILRGQGSHILKSFAQANALVLLPEGDFDFKRGEEIEVHLLPNFVGSGEAI